jgi:alkyl sulfatase BDS1-like metallo-beta-lactamase superfamily hydrolase
MNLKYLPFLATLILVLGNFFGAAQAQEFKHFHPKGKPPSAHTLKIFEAARVKLPFHDTQDFEEQAKGFIARRTSKSRRKVLSQPLTT